jgi:hypothetical protein
MKIVSIDVGIKNLSFCLLELFNNSNDLKILKWDTIDLTEKYEYKCIQIDKNGLCDKPAKFIKDTKCYCLKHAKKQNFLQPTPDLKESFLKKQKIQSLIDIAKKYKVHVEDHPKKVDLINSLLLFSSENCFENVEKNSASKTDLVTIGRNIQHKFDDILQDHLSNIDTIIIENQIGPIANKMKTIQGMLAQYFIMKNNNIKIEFISAINKLKDFLQNPQENNKTQPNSHANEKEKGIKKPKMDYKERKKMSIQITSNFVSTDYRFKEWEGMFAKHQKKDDLSDCFLQCMWYIKNKI